MSILNFVDIRFCYLTEESGYRFLRNSEFRQLLKENNSKYWVFCVDKGEESKKEWLRL